MKERPILFSPGPMVKAIMAGQKTQTRRLVNPLHRTRGLSAFFVPGMASDLRPYADVGDKLWVRETWSQSATSVYPCPACWYRADFSPLDDPAVGYQMHVKGCGGNRSDCFPCAALREGKFKWRPSIYMPRHLSRVTLDVTSIRVERLNDISDDDARAEGCGGRDPEPIAEGGTIYAMQGRSSAPSPRAHFMCLWDSINWKRAPWHSNPWVWVVGFRRLP